MILMSIFDIWDKLPIHARMIIGISTVIATLVKPLILLIKWFKEKNSREPEGDELLVPFSVKISSKKRKIKWYKDKLNNHNIFFQFNELIKYEIDSNKFSFGTSEKTRIFRQILRIYLGVLSDNVRKFYDSKVELDSLTDKEFAEHFDTFVSDTNSQIYKKFQDAFTTPVFNLVIMNENKGFVHYIEKHKKHFINAVKEMIRHDKKLYDNTNYRKVWEILSLLRLVIWVGLDDFSEYYEEFNGDLDDALKK